MIARSPLTALATLFLTSAALAAPVLKADIVVSAAVVTVGDMFDGAGLAAEGALFRAPKPGTSGIVSLADVQIAAARAGLEAFDTNGVDAVRVSRLSTIVDQAFLTDLISADLFSRGILSAGMSANTVFTTQITALNAEAIARPANIISMRYLPGNGAFLARVAVAGIDQPLDLSGSIELMIDAPHLAGNLPAGTVVTADNIEMRPVPLRFVESTGVARLEDIIGKALTRQSRDGMMLKPADVTTPLLITKNDLVTIYFRKGPLTLTVKGQAITGATTGAPLQVLNLVSKRVITTTALAPGAVEVSTDPLALAGL